MTQYCHARSLIGAIALLSLFVTHQSQAQEITFVGSTSCTECHQQQNKQWQGSHHQQAMQHASEQSVLGRFDGQVLNYADTPYRFYRNGADFVIDADNPKGNVAPFKVRFTFGVYPLQQYLVEFAGGRLQALPIAWDARPQSQGGQRWFHLYPDEAIRYDDELHWTGANQNWNFMCADCHSTGLDKNYDLASDSFDTQWAEISVGCEACHGQGSDHQQWAKKPESARAQDPSKGLPVRFDQQTTNRWIINPGSNTATRTPASKDSHTTEVERCASCHSRRLAQAPDQAGTPLENSLSLSLLETRLYHNDGQIKDEVFEHGSFIQSKMYHEGVSCSDCHNSHSLELRAPGAEVCSQCHRSDYFTSPEHSHHRSTTADNSASGSATTKTAIKTTSKTTAARQPDCLDCHMPSTNYMVVDPRRDHSLRVPRPDLTVSQGTPNACQSCHADRSDNWAASNVQQWLGRNASGFQTYATALEAGRKGALDAEAQLLRLLASQQPAIARASALQLLTPVFRWQNTAPLLTSLNDSDAIVRKAAIGVVEALPVQQRIDLMLPLLSDPVRSVRMEAARLLASLPQTALPANAVTVRNQALDEFIQAQLFNAERPESHLNLGNLYRDQGKIKTAEQSYRQAIALNRRFSPAWANLADLYRAKGLEQQSIELLQQGLAEVPEDPTLLVAQGFSLIRQQRQSQALQAFAKAVEYAPDNSRYHYIYGIALSSTPQQQSRAIKQFEKARELFPANSDALTALLDAALRGQDYPKAHRYATELQQLTPWNQQLDQLLKQLNARKG
ncbi:MAG: multiheme c-type cytochrome [Motiliproteus sp.]